MGIVGVVASIILPNFIVNHRKQVVETRLKKFYSEMNQAVQNAQIEYGDASTWESWDANRPTHETYKENFEFLQKYFLPYLKTLNVKPCPFSKTKACVTLANGSAFSYGQDHLTFFPQEKDLYNVEKMFQGKNCFAFIIVPDGHHFYDNGKGVQAYSGSWNGKYNVLFTHFVYGCRNTQVQCGDTINKYCTKIIQVNGWKIPKEYPIKF